MTLALKFLIHFLILVIFLSKSQCENSITGKITEGTETQKSLGKHIVAIFSVINSAGEIIPSHRFRCTGSILNKRFVITSASCLFYVFKEDDYADFIRLEPKYFKIYAGISRISKMYNTPKLGIDVLDMRAHRNFNPLAFERGYNVGLMVLRKDLNEDGINIQRIHLALGAPNTRDSYVLYGWGSFGENVVSQIQEPNNTLLYLSTSITKKEDCIIRDISNTDICININGNGACYYNFGSPLVKIVASDKTELVGILSLANCQGQGYDVFAGIGINANRRWLLRNKKQLEAQHKVLLTANGNRQTITLYLFFMLLAFLSFVRIYY